MCLLMNILMFEELSKYLEICVLVLHFYFSLFINLLFGSTF